MADVRLPPGIKGIHALPADHHDGPWDSIFVPPGTKEQLLGTAILVLRHGRALRSLSGPPHGLVVLAGPPGTGKTTLCQGLAQAAASRVAQRGATTFVEIDPHAFPSEMLGESQRAVRRLFTETLPELAARRPHTIVLVDEVEALAVRRAAASFETNPVDVHRATDAVLAGLDALQAACPHVLLLTTTNFTTAVDEAFLSRADLVLELDLPDQDVLARIIRSSLTELATLWPPLRHLADDAGLHAKLADRCAGFDGRRARKVVLAALARHPDVAADPARLTAEDLLAAAEAVSDLTAPVGPWHSAAMWPPTCCTRTTGHTCR
ncbi:AAA family ATPase [Micromonospora yasonensis]|uniref:AAA family ATPase n=1 Tax=Micromonospora yasonensis TaxID=1128667 RepID=UPI0022319A18|nr:AAA family ATPase [Micromonospora yasonensis]MCW3844814.1 AAA family ATPase [Micromonospora yasonensis]